MMFNLKRVRSYQISTTLSDVLYWLQVIIFRTVIYLHRSIAVVYYWNKHKTVPPIKNRLLLKSAKELAEDIRNGQLKSKEVVQAYIDRILEVEPYINAVVQDRFQEALEEAEVVDELIQSKIFSRHQLEENKPLFGVPITIKALLKVKGHSFSAGHKFYKDVVAEEDAPCVTLLKDAGGIIIATTNIPEFGLYLETRNQLQGKTCNPYDTSRTPGGSSGGESALLAAGASAVGIGNDMAGSVRIPAHFTGLYAHKPSKDIVPNGGSFPLTKAPSSELRDFISTGPMCRFAEDLVLMMNVLTAENKSCGTFSKKVDFKQLKILYSTNIRDPRVLPVDKDIENGIHKAISHFTCSYGVTATELNLPLYDKMNDIAYHIFRTPLEDILESLATESSVEINAFRELYHNLFGDSNISIGTLIAFIVLRCPLYVKKQNIPLYKDLLQKLKEEFDNLLDHNTVFICPTFSQTAPYHSEMIGVLGLSLCYTSLCNLTGMPSTAVPMGLNGNGLPQGMQIIGKRNNDPLTIACAVELNKVFGGWIPPGNVENM